MQIPGESPGGSSSTFLTKSQKNLAAAIREFRINSVLDLHGQ